MSDLGTTSTHDLLRFATAGSVDDGKSTLVGRLLHDTKSILTDTLAAVERASQPRAAWAAALPARLIAALAAARLLCWQLPLHRAGFWCFKPLHQHHILQGEFQICRA